VMVNGDDIDDVGDGGITFDGHRVCFFIRFDGDESPS
jgi:hypothetical protein